jgi:hypothetical protein
VKTSQRGWQDGFTIKDAALGFAPLPGGRGAHVFPIGSSVPTRYDQDGFRVPVESAGNAREGARPHLLALGDSFTYGDGCLAEDAYPARAAAEIGGTALNAGVCAYGLAQMLVRARTVIPLAHAEVVLVQFSPWLVDRARTPFAPSFYGKVTTPYFVAAKDGAIALHGPVFETAVCDLPIGDYRGKPADDFASFLARVGLPLYVHDDFQMLAYELRCATGALPPAATDGAPIVSAVYGEIASLARASGSRVVVPFIGGYPAPDELAALRAIPGLTLVDAQGALVQALADRTPDGFKQAYGLWRGSPPVLVDPHPNPRAHAILGSAVARALSR